jgi:hypothetical protein
LAWRQLLSEFPADDIFHILVNTLFPPFILIGGKLRVSSIDPAPPHASRSQGAIRAWEQSLIFFSPQRCRCQYKLCSPFSANHGEYRSVRLLHSSVTCCRQNLSLRRSQNARSHKRIVTDWIEKRACKQKYRFSITCILRLLGRHSPLRNPNYASYTSLCILHLSTRTSLL